MKFKTSSMYWQMALPVVIVGIIIITALTLLVPGLIKKNVIDNAALDAERTVQQFKTIRGYYTKNVIKPVLASKSELRPGIEHKGDSQKIPLPATMIHDISDELKKEGITLNLYSRYPFPNRGNRKLDDFQQKAWDYLNDNPGKTMHEEQTVNGRRVLRVAIADLMVAEACVSCHNSHPQTPKNDWKVNDVRGVLEVVTDIEAQLAASGEVKNTILIVIVAALLLLVAMIALTFHRSVGRSLASLSNSIQRISTGDGDLTQRIETKGADEIVALSEQFNAFVEQIHQTVSGITSSFSRMETQMHELDKMTQTVNQGASQQQMESNSIATAVMEMTASSAHVSDSAVHAAEETTRVEKSAMSGKQIVSATVNGITELTDDIHSANDVISKLAEQSDNVGTVLDVIRGIAEQTNLLALNAAIEAARAGEQGRGFAVVADEVRTLASRTQDSTEEIQRIISELQEGSHRAVAVMNKSQTQANKTAELATGAGTSLDEIVSAMEIINNMNSQIAVAVKEQLSTAESVSRNVIEIQTIAETTADQSTSATQSAKEAVSQVDALKALLQRFKV